MKPDIVDRLVAEAEAKYGVRRRCTYARERRGSLIGYRPHAEEREGYAVGPIIRCWCAREGVTEEWVRSHIEFVTYCPSEGCGHANHTRRMQKGER